MGGPTGLNDSPRFPPVALYKASRSALPFPGFSSSYKGFLPPFFLLCSPEVNLFPKLTLCNPLISFFRCSRSKVKLLTLKFFCACELAP